MDCWFNKLSMETLLSDMAISSHQVFILANGLNFQHQKDFSISYESMQSTLNTFIQKNGFFLLWQKFLCFFVKSIVDFLEKISNWTWRSSIQTWEATRTCDPGWSFCWCRWCIATRQLKRRTSTAQDISRLAACSIREIF